MTNETDSGHQYAQKFKDRYSRTFVLAPDHAEDGTIMGWSIATSFRPKRDPAKGEFPFSVWQFSDTHIASLIPSRHVKDILERHPAARLHLDTDEGTVLLFPTENLNYMAADLKLKRRRKLSVTHREKLIQMGIEHRFKAPGHGSNEQENG